MKERLLHMWTGKKAKLRCWGCGGFTQHPVCREGFSAVGRCLKCLVCLWAQKVFRQKTGRELWRKCAQIVCCLDGNYCYPKWHIGEDFWLQIIWSLWLCGTSLLSCHHSRLLNSDFRLTDFCTALAEGGLMWFDATSQKPWTLVHYHPFIKVFLKRVLQEMAGMWFFVEPLFFNLDQDTASQPACEPAS